MIGAFYGIFSSIKRLACALVIVSCGLSISACSNLEQNIALGAAMRSNRYITSDRLIPLANMSRKCIASGCMVRRVLSVR